MAVVSPTTPFRGIKAQIWVQRTESSALLGYSSTRKAHSSTRKVGRIPKNIARGRFWCSVGYPTPLGISKQTSRWLKHRKFPHEIPSAISNSVVRLEVPNADNTTGRTEVYLLGMSHVSKASVEAVRSLIEATRPEVVLVEVCRDRVGLMLNPDGPNDLQLWTSRKVMMSGLPSADGWPTESEILSVTESRPGRAFSTPDVEADCVRLLSLGLFRSVRPSFKRPTSLDCPQFVRVTGHRFATVPPLGPIEFIVTPRTLPTPFSFSARVDSSLRSTNLSVPEEEVKQIEQRLLKDCGRASEEQATAEPPAQQESSSSQPASLGIEGPDSTEPPTEEQENASSSSSESTKPVAKAPTLDALLRARRDLMAALHSQHGSAEFEVSLNGVETGDIEAVIKAKGSREVFCSGLENSALGGEGPGIETFKPQRGPLQISSNLKIPNLVKILRRSGEHSEEFVAAVPPQPNRSMWRFWTPEEMVEAESSEEDDEASESLGEKSARLLSQVYAELQNAAAEKVGVKSGAAWRAALEAASENGGLQVHLGDMPADLAAQNLANGIVRGLSTRVTAAAVVTAAAATAAIAHTLPDGTGPIAAAAIAAAVSSAAVPFLGPVLELFLFSKKSASQIEEAVRIKESLQARGSKMLRLPGEDAIVSWPNAKESIIDSRDSYMARTLYAAATGKGASPAFILDTSGERHVWRYAMPRDAPEGCSETGCGDGEYEALKGANVVVGIVGSAHVAGIVREWENAKSTDMLAELQNTISS